MLLMGGPRLLKKNKADALFKRLRMEDSGNCSSVCLVWYVEQIIIVELTSKKVNFWTWKVQDKMYKGEAGNVIYLDARKALFTVPTWHYCKELGEYGFGETTARKAYYQLKTTSLKEGFSIVHLKLYGCFLEVPQILKYYSAFL